MALALPPARSPAARVPADSSRATALSRLGRNAESALDLEQAALLADEDDRTRFLALRAHSLALAGDLVRATTEAERLAGRSALPGQPAYVLARVYALCAARTTDSAGASRHAARGAELLGRALAAGYFRDPVRVSQCKADAVMTHVMKTPEARRLLAELLK
jgi:hypothetical protein